MILLLDTSTPVCHVYFFDGEDTAHVSWDAGRQLSLGLLSYLEEQLLARDIAWSDISGIVVFRGPGSFTGLRIGATVINALVSVTGTPSVGVMGDDWRAEGIARIQAGESDGVILPEYGSDANITTPRK